MATARTADAVAICAAGGKKICDDRLPLRRLMQSSGKRLLPRLGVSATNSPIPQHGRTVDVRWQSPGPGRNASEEAVVPTVKTALKLMLKHLDPTGNDRCRPPRPAQRVSAARCSALHLRKDES